jgi:hypothetical protein
MCKVENKDQGNLGEAYAIYKLTELGYKLSKPLIENIGYDLIADLNGVLYRIQVKSSSYSRFEGLYDVALATRGGNRSGVGKSKNISSLNCDYVFIYTAPKSYLIPIQPIDGQGSVRVGGKGTKDYEIREEIMI